MSVTSSITELRALQTSDLLREIAEQETHVVKLRMGVKMGMEKDSAKYVRERKHLARMKTILTEKSDEKSPSVSPKSSVSSAPAKKSSRKKS